jgi:hypothetical protein
MKNHPIDDLCLAIDFGVESSGFYELGVQQRPETRLKCVDQPSIPVGDDGMLYPKVDPHSF